ncbi:MAG: mechanosensitive ion channel domain-containing protein, partial [Lentisphaeria bacterium]
IRMQLENLGVDEMQSLAEKLIEWLTLYGLKALAAIAIFIIGRWIAMCLRGLLRRLMLKSHLEETLISFICNLSYDILIVFIIIAALGQLGIQTASFVAVLGAAGLAVGLALQGSLTNFAAGLLLIIFKPFKVGDYVEAGGIGGIVEEIGIFTTEFKSIDGKKIIVPNNKISADTITNYSAKPQRRLNVIASVSYSDDLDKVRNVLEKIIQEESRVLPDPKPMIVVAELGSSSINFAVRPWVKTADYWDVLFAMNETIKKRFDAEGISIPFPQQDVHLYHADKK